MKQAFIILGSLVGVLFLVLVVYLAAHNIRVPGEARTVERSFRVDTIYEGGVKDIVFAQSDGAFYYINRGLEQGYTLEGLRRVLLNKTVTLRVPNVLAGPSAHIEEMRVGDSIIFDENKTKYYNRNLRSEQME